MMDHVDAVSGVSLANAYRICLPMLDTCLHTLTYAVMNVAGLVVRSCSLPSNKLAN